MNPYDQSQKEFSPHNRTNSDIAIIFYHNPYWTLEDPFWQNRVPKLNEAAKKHNCKRSKDALLIRKSGDTFSS